MFGSTYFGVTYFGTNYWGPPETHFVSIYDSDSSISLESSNPSQFTSVSDLSNEDENQLSFIISTIDLFSTDSATGFETSTVLILVGPTLQDTTYTQFFNGIIAILNESLIFGQNSVDYVVWQDNEIKWPTGPAPFALIEPDHFPWDTEGIGGGRFSKTFTTEFKIHIVVNNIYDISYKDTNLVTSIDSQVGPYKLVDKVINMVEQAWVTDPTGKLIVVELPYALNVDPPVRYEGDNSYSDIIITFHVKIVETMSVILT